MFGKRRMCVAEIARLSCRDLGQEGGEEGCRERTARVCGRWRNVCRGGSYVRDRLGRNTRSVYMNYHSADGKNK